MKNMIRLIVVFACIAVATSCKKGALGPDGTPLGRSYSPGVTGGSNGAYASILGPSTGGGGDTIQLPEVTVVYDSVWYKGSGYRVNAACSSSGGYYGISATAGSPSFVTTVYLPSKPTSSGSYTIEDINGTSPGSGKAWVVVTDNGTPFTASFGTVYVTVKDGSVGVYFGCEVSDGSTSRQIEADLHCNQ